MEKATRLFDCMEIQAQNPLPDLLNGKVNGEWVNHSTGQIHEKVYQLAKALIDLGVSAGDGTTEGRDKIGLISSGRPEWLITDLAVQLTGAILVPLYPNTSLKELELVLNEADVKYMFVSNKELYDKVDAIRSHTASLKTIYTFDKIDGCLNWETLLNPVTDEDRSKINAISDQVTASSVATIIYTSGTTGNPKGVMLSHKNILSNVVASSYVMREIPAQEKRVLSFLPLNHIFEKMCTYMYLFYGYSIYYAESMDTIGADLKAVKPYIFTSVPRLLEKVFEKIMLAGQGLTGLKRKLFLWSIKLAERFELVNTSIWYKMQLAIADKLIFSKWRAAVGGNVKAIVVGSSATPIRLERIFTAAGMVILEGYGLTETSPVISVNHYNPERRKFGTVGPLIGGIEVKIDADGEILCKGPNVMVGYYKKPDLTAEVIQDGWFHTGDIGVLDEDRFLRITDRKKEIFKTSGGKYVAPLPIENRMKESPFIEQMMVIGADRKFTAALIVPSFVNLKVWCKGNDVVFSSNEQLVKEEKVIALFHKIVVEYNVEFNHVEQVKKIALLPNEWSIESGELTPTGKMKRVVIMAKYKDTIDEIYSDESIINHVL